VVPMMAMVLLAVLVAPPDTSPPGEARVVERIVAVVRNPAGAAPRPITLTRLTEEARIALIGRGGVEAATATLDAPALRAALRGLIDQWLVADEAKRLQVDEVAREDVLLMLRHFQDRFPSPEAYRTFLASADLSEAEVEVTLTRQLKVQRYLDSRVGRAARVTDEEVAAFLEKRGATLESASARQAVRQQLSAEKVGIQVRQLLADLRGRADVRVLLPELREDGAR
jgi:hypothetical protein